jgi:ribosomal protein L37AE/L43A
MMTTCLVFVLVILLPCSAYVGRYHLMVLAILVMSVLAVATLLSLTLVAFGLDASSLRADRVVTRLRTPSLLTAFIGRTECEKGFYQSRILAVHRILHMNGSSHQCPFCQRSSNQRSNLKIHLLTHIDHKPYECNQCRKVFRRNCDQADSVCEPDTALPHLLSHDNIKKAVL